MTQTSHSSTPTTIELFINGRAVRVEPGTSVAAAMLAFTGRTRRSVAGEARAPLCGMGVCMECRATVDGVAHVRTCQAEARPGMQVNTE